MNPEMQATLLNTYPPKWKATILKSPREQPKETGQLNAVGEIVGPIPANSFFNMMKYSTWT